MCVCVCVSACVFLCLCVCARTRARRCVCVCVSTHMFVSVCRHLSAQSICVHFVCLCVFFFQCESIVHLQFSHKIRHASALGFVAQHVFTAFRGGTREPVTVQQGQQGIMYLSAICACFYVTL